MIGIFIGASIFALSIWFYKSMERSTMRKEEEDQLKFEKENPGQNYYKYKLLKKIEDNKHKYCAVCPKCGHYSVRRYKDREINKYTYERYVCDYCLNRWRSI